MNIWLINHYAVPTKYYPLTRPATFAKYLIRKGHTVTIFASSTVHNSSINLIEDGSFYKEEYIDDIHYVYVKNIGYTGNGIKRIINMFLFPLRLPRVCKLFDKPDAILSVSVTPMACKCGINLAHKYKCKGVAEIADLWPETFVAYGFLGKNNPILKPLYAYERALYKKADEIIFTMEGGKDYIISKKWDKEQGGSIDLNKIHHINNGVDLEAFQHNKENYIVSDEDLDNPDIFKVLYTGAIRTVNNVEQLVYIAQKLEEKGNSNIKLIIYGDGNEKEMLATKANELGLGNIVFKGNVPKEKIPSILSKADLCLLHWKPTPLTKFGMSMNKLFDYLASGKPILSNSKPNYDIISSRNCGISENIKSVDEYADYIVRFAEMSKDKYVYYCKNARATAKEFDLKSLTDKLINIIEK